MSAGLLLVTGLGGLAGLLLVLVRRRLAPRTDSLVDLVNATLPQTQCAQCGYPGCRPYAAAIVSGEAINRCPPGGEATIAALSDLLGRPVLPLDEDLGEEPPPAVAVIREAECIGCTLCINACPVDAIVGAAQQMHTVIADECTGCDLCREPCPVDCIDLIPLTPSAMTLPVMPTAGELACINCGACAPACPRHLQPQLLYWFREAPEQAEMLRIDQCIECRRCDSHCPSDLPLTASFRATKARLQDTRRRRETAAAVEQKYIRRESRRHLATARVAQRPSGSERHRLLEALKAGSSEP